MSIFWKIKTKYYAPLFVIKPNVNMTKNKSIKQLKWYFLIKKLNYFKQKIANFL